MGGGPRALRSAYGGVSGRRAASAARGARSRCDGLSGPSETERRELGSGARERRGEEELEHRRVEEWAAPRERRRAAQLVPARARLDGQIGG